MHTASQKVYCAARSCQTTPPPRGDCAAGCDLRKQQELRGGDAHASSFFALNTHPWCDAAAAVTSQDKFIAYALSSLSSAKSAPGLLGGFLALRLEVPICKGEQSQHASRKSVSDPTLS
eukprot:5299308-Pleurochrysis_carterae.AAC.2